MSSALREAVTTGGFTIWPLVMGGRWAENCYLVQHIASGEIVVVDPGDPPQLIIEQLRTLGGRVRSVLLTHAHHDHVAGAAAVCDAFGLPCCVQRGDARLLRHAPMYSVRFGGPQFAIPQQVEPFEEFPAIALGDSRVRTILTPGHTAGSACYCFGSAVLTGDTLLRNHVGRTDLPGGDATALHTSLDNLFTGLGPETLLLPGHGSAWTVAEAFAWWRRVGGAPPKFGLSNPDENNATICS
jgi:hydroxyacylglutathione hydrolase